MKRHLALGVAVLGLFGAGFLWTAGQGTEPAVTSFSAEAQEVSEDVDTSMIQEMTLGEADAPVQVIEYASFTCPHCRSFHETAFQQIKENYVDTGDVEFVYREVYFDRYGLWAGMVARCAGPERYFGLVDLIYEQQSEWAKGGPAEIAENLRRIGKTAGLNDEQLDACMQDAEKAEALVAVYQQNREADDINSTPTFIIDGEKYSNMSYDDFSAILDEKLAEAE
ncbi:DsbA family protein [Tranquillimonas alkanivorans]|uniref:Thioredoxin n=1 Tax=Tranquillimonas alkanivorans TaxID=441119 RepID=A0A1I5L4C5_9RHOB|nr:DsbA family protein [Tranquillimonas alkanivorans]SFO92124.1 Thioredoxin [Tranquillimonas alkanivorans]